MQNAYMLWGFSACAERCAIDHAALHGNRRIKEVAIVMDARNRNEPEPCDVCLQYIHDFADNAKIMIVVAKAEKGRILFETVKVKLLEELLPFPFKK